VAAAPKRVRGKVALVTGAASGIGRATALLLADEGATVLATDLDAAGAARSAAAIRAAGGAADARALDVANEASWQAAVGAVRDAFGSLDILVNNAGISHARPVTDTPLEEWRRVMAVNLDGVLLGLKHGIRVMRETGGGVIVNVSSASGVKASAGAAAYCASKAAVRMLARVAALECAAAGDRIRINTVLPGGVKTPMWEGMDFFAELTRHEGVEGAWRAVQQGTPGGRFAEPEEVARAILFLASDEASYVNGAELAVDYGLTAS
jgi:NAD(P)-dependent dehydrogenase (short-subunit alcohol dehydrogenase family)